MNRFTKEYLVEQFTKLDKLYGINVDRSKMSIDQLNKKAFETFIKFNVNSFEELEEKMNKQYKTRTEKRIEQIKPVVKEIKAKQKDIEHVDQINFLRKRELEEELKQLKVKVNDIVNDLESYKEPIGPTNYPKKDDALFVNLPDDYGKFESTLYDYHHNFPLKEKIREKAEITNEYFYHRPTSTDYILDKLVKIYDNTLKPFKLGFSVGSITQEASSSPVEFTYRYYTPFNFNHFPTQTIQNKDDLNKVIELIKDYIEQHKHTDVDGQLKSSSSKYIAIVGVGFQVTKLQLSGKSY